MNLMNRDRIWMALVAGTIGALSIGCGADDAAPAPGDGEKPKLSPKAMVAAKCADGTCRSGDVIGYWKDSWNEYAVQRHVTFHEASETSHHMMITDGAGSPSTLDFEAGVPVTLTIKNPGDGVTGKHYFTAPDFYQKVAWRKVETADAEYKAPYFTAVELLYEAGVDKELELYFVPMLAGTYDAYCEVDILKGADGKNDLATGHAGHGMKTTIGVAGDLGVALDQQVHPDWDRALGADPRRSSSDPVWADGVRNDTFSVKKGTPIQMVERGTNDLAFRPSEIALVQGTAYVLGFTNDAAHESTHYFTAHEFLRSVVLRKAEDSQAEVKAPYFTAIELVLGGSTDLLFVPTVTGQFSFYCENGVTHSANGTPDLSTGHAAVGAKGSVTVTAP